MTAYDTALLGLPSVVGYWPLDDAPGATALRDASGGPIGAFPFSAPRGSAGNTSILPGDTSTCIHKTDAVSLAISYAGLSTAGKAAVNQTGNITIIAWFQADTVTPADATSRQFLFGQFDNARVKSAYTLNLAGRALTFAIEDAGHSQPSVTSSQQPTILPNSPFMVVGVYDQTHLLTYLNGVLVASSAHSGALTGDVTTNLELGGVLGGIGFKGYMQKVAFLGAALTQEQIQALYLIGARSTALAAGAVTVYPFSTQVLAAGARSSVTLQNTSDTPMYGSLGGSAQALTGFRINPNGGEQTFTQWVGSIQVCHGGWLGAKTLLVQTT